MDARRADALRFQGFAMLMFALLQGGLILAKVGAPAAQGRAHIETFIFAFVLIFIGMNAASLKLPAGALRVLYFAAPAACWLGVLHAVGVATLGAASIHQTGTVSAATEQVLQLIGAVSALLSLTSVALVLRGSMAR